MKIKIKFMPLLLSISMLAMPLRLGAILKVYRLNGDVLIKKTMKTMKAQRRAPLNGEDILVIPQGAHVEILDSESQRIYSSSTFGRISVRKLIANADNDANAITMKTNQRVLSAIRDNANTKKSSFHNQGLTVHNTDDVVYTPMKLPEGVSYLGYLMNLSDVDQYDDSYDIILMRRDYSDSDNTFNFAVFNTLEDPLYVNIIDQKNTDSPKLYFEENPVAAPREETVISQYRYLLPVDLEGYIVIASNKNFTKEDIVKLLDAKYNPEQDFYFSLLRL